LLLNTLSQNPKSFINISKKDNNYKTEDKKDKTNKKIDLTFINNINKNDNLNIKISKNNLNSKEISKIDNFKNELEKNLKKDFKKTSLKEDKINLKNELKTNENISVDLKNQNNQLEIKHEIKLADLPKSRNDFNNLMMTSLKERLEEKINQDFVKNTNFLLKNYDSGEIKLLLKPDTLGSIRMKFLMEDGSLNGKIIVENYNVKDIFNNNINSLIESFKHEGIEVGDLEVFTGEENQNSQQDDKKKNKKEEDNNDLLFELNKIKDESVINIIT